MKHGATHGVDHGGKRIVGRRRHVAVDADGRLLMVNLTPADLSDSADADGEVAIGRHHHFLRARRCQRLLLCRRASARHDHRIHRARELDGMDAEPAAAGHKHPLSGLYLAV
jgi:hypothetical protein